MLFLVVASIFVSAAVDAAVDPSKVCLPDVLETQVASLLSSTVRTVAFDFPNKRIASRSENGLRAVYDLSNYVSCLINETAGTCSKSAAGDPLAKVVGAQCLPANATLISGNKTVLGLTPGGIEIQGWDYETTIGSVRVGVTATSPQVPILRQYHTSAGVNVDLFIDPQLTISDKTIFDVPADCPPATIVG